MNNSVKIYTSHHKPSAFLNAAIIKPLHVGKLILVMKLVVQEMTLAIIFPLRIRFIANLLRIIGFGKTKSWQTMSVSCTIAVILIFPKNKLFLRDTWGVVNHPCIDEEYEKIFGLNEETIQRCVEGIDILLPKKMVCHCGGK